MKITDITTVVVNAHMRNWIFVKVQTDVPGLHGWGEATMEWKTRAVSGCVEDLKPMILGRDPTRIDFLWQILYRHSYFRAGAIGMSAISGIEQACCDITAKSMGVPSLQAARRQGPGQGADVYASGRRRSKGGL